MNARRIVLLALGLTICAALAANAEVELPYIQTENVIYADAYGVALVMDVFTPSGKGLLPVYKPSESGKGLGIVDIASGAWSSDRGKIEDHKTAKMYNIFCARGYTVFAVRPGSSENFTGDDMLRNIRRGIRYVKAHASDYSIDPERLGLCGASAGGHLSCMTACTAEDGNPNANDPLGKLSTRVKAVGVFFPPTDFLNWDGKEAPLEKYAGLFIKGGFAGHSREEILDAAKAMSPIYLVKPGLPPFMFFHGDADPLVPLQQSQSMVEAIKAAGGSADLFVKQGGGHPWLTIPEEVITLADWFDKQLAAK